MVVGGVLQYVGGVAGQWPLLSALSLLTLLLVLAYYALRPRGLPPGPWGIPWVGSPHLLSDDVHHDLARLGDKYGDICSLMMGLRPVIVLNSNRLIREAFVKRAEEFANRPIMYDLDYMDLYDELFNIRYSEKWRERKRVMVRILRAAGFGSSLVEGMFQKNLDKMYANINKDSTDLKEPLQRLLAMTLAEVVYGEGYEYNDKELDQLVKLSMDWMASVYREGMALGYWTDNVPYSITKYLMPTMMNNMKTSTLAFQEFLLQKINAHRKTFDKAHPKPDVVDGYLAERGDDPELTDNAFSSTILMLFPDGIDSTGSLLQYIALYLAYYPEWQRKVQAQIDEVCGTRQPSLADRPNLPLVEATIYEVGRVASVVCLTIAHCPMQNTTFEGYNIPQDSYILANLWAAHMDKEIFPQGESFAPETLLDSNGKFVRNDKILMFSAGRRMCVGEQMVKNEAFLYIATTLQRYDIRFPDGQPLPSLVSTGGLIREPQPFNIRFVARKV